MKKKKELIIILGSLLVVVLSVTLAYFTTEIFGTGKDISLDSANLKITFSSGSGNISGVNIEPGWSSGISTFTVKNESNDTYKYNIVIKDLVNTFVTTGFLQYKITSTDGGYNMSDFTDVPKSDVATDTILAYSVEIAKGAAHTYSVEFKYENSTTEDQSDDMGKKLSGTLFIEKGTKQTVVLTTLIKSNANTNTNGVYNENGYRYEGSDPSNYIYMTNKSTNTKELWRIIGVFNDGENGEEVIRVRRHYEQNSYPEMAYDSNDTNHWPKTTMYNALSSIYKLANYSHTVNFKMYLGTASSTNSFTALEWYTAERGNVPGKTSASSYSNSVIFIGSVGLMYPSDYGYGVLASDCARTIELYNYDGTETCYSNNWLFLGKNYHRLMSPDASVSSLVFYTASDGYVGSKGMDMFNVEEDGPYSPVMALSKTVLVNGSGTKTEPYEIIN